MCISGILIDLTLKSKTETRANGLPPFVIPSSLTESNLFWLGGTIFGIN